MLRIFRKNKNKPGAVQDVQLRPAEQSGQDALELRLEDTRRQLGKRLGALLTNRNSIDEDLLDEIETTLITSDIGVNAALKIVGEPARRHLKPGHHRTGAGIARCAGRTVRTD